MPNIIEDLLGSAPVVTDGAWGTQLQARGLTSGNCPDQWNLSHPELVAEVPREYVQAGSQVVLTNTFRANCLALAEYGLADKTEEINRAGVEISLRAAAGEACVFGSIGPSGKMLLTGDVSTEQLKNAFDQQAQALTAAGAHGLVIETMSDLTEALLALEAAKATSLPVVACMIFDSGPHKDHTMMGNSAKHVARVLTDAGADVIGANCGQGIESYLEVCRQLRSATHRPIWIKANAGQPEIEGENIVYRTTAEEFAKHGPALVAAGANFLGGCCGTGPEFIRALKRRISG